MYRFICLILVVIIMLSKLSTVQAFVPQTITITGDFYYQDLDLDVIPLRYARVEIWEKFNSGPDLQIKVEHLTSNQYLVVVKFELIPFDYNDR